MNFATIVASAYPILSEASLHPHAPEERAGLFSAVDGGTAELEVLNFLNALVYLLKPLNALETGTGSGLTTAAIAAAMQMNGVGFVHSVELNDGERVRAGQTIARLMPGLVDRVTLHNGDSREFIRNWKGDPFDFCFFDSLIAFRHEELGLLLERGLLYRPATCVFHDTSRRRGEYFPDFNPEMIEALDQHSAGRQWFESEFSRGLRLIHFT